MEAGNWEGLIRKREREKQMVIRFGDVDSESNSCSSDNEIILFHLRIR
jgi:hypothetical protein